LKLNFRSFGLRSPSILLTLLAQNALVGNGDRAVASINDEVAAVGAQITVPLPAGPGATADSIKVDIIEAGSDDDSASTAGAAHLRAETIATLKANPGLEGRVTVLGSGELEEDAELLSLAQRIRDGIKDKLEVEQLAISDSDIEAAQSAFGNAMKRERLVMTLVRGVANGGVNFLNLFLSRQLPLPVALGFSVLVGTGSGCFQYYTKSMNRWFGRGTTCKWLGISSDSPYFKSINVAEKLWKWFASEILFNSPNAFATNLFNTAGVYVGFWEVVAASFWGVLGQGTWELGIHNMANKALEKDPLNSTHIENVESQRRTRILAASLIGVTLVTLQMVGSHYEGLETFAKYALYSMGASGTILFATTAYADKVKSLGWVQRIRTVYVNAKEQLKAGFSLRRESVIGGLLMPGPESLATPARCELILDPTLEVRSFN